MILTASARADQVKAMKPDWCDGVEIDPELRIQQYEIDNKNTTRPLEAMERALNAGFTDQSLQRLAKTACVRPDDAVYQAGVAKWRQAWIDRIGISEKQDREHQKVRASRDWETQKTAHCSSLQPNDEASLEDKAMAGAIAAGTGCAIGSRGGEVLDLQHDGWQGPPEAWWIDTREEVSSQIARAVFVTHCLRFVDDGKAWPDPKRTVVMAAYATCGPDARRLDAAAFEKELADKRYNAYARLHARETFAQAVALTAYLTAEYQKLAKDAAYQKLLFDAPETAWKQWEKDYAANREAFEAAKAYETKFYGPSKKALQGCGAALRKHFSTYIKAKKPKTAQEAQAAALDPIGYQLVQSLSLCDAVEGRMLAARTEGELLDGAGKGAPPVRRGPRMEASYAAQHALGEILADRDKFPVKVGEFRADMSISRPDKDIRTGANDLYTNQTTYPGHDPTGTLTGVDKNVVSFRPVKTTVPNIICVPNNRIVYISSSGEVIYDKDCHREGNVTLTDVEKPLAIPAELAGGLKAGQVGVFTGNDSATPRGGFPKAVYADKEMTKLVIWFGVAL
jgi:hypothetical protein